MAFFYYHIRDYWQTKQDLNDLRSEFHPDFLGQLDQCHEDQDCQVMHRYFKLMLDRKKQLGDDSYRVFHSTRDSAILDQMISGLSPEETRDKIYSHNDFRLLCQELLNTEKRLGQKFGVPVKLDKITKENN